MLLLLRRSLYSFSRPHAQTRNPYRSSQVHCLVLHPVSSPNHGPLIEQYLAEEAIGLAKSLNWLVKEGPFWNDGSAIADAETQQPLNTQQEEHPVKNGDYVYTPAGKGIYYQGGVIFDPQESDSEGDLYDEWKNKLVRASLANKCLVKTRRITQKLYFTRGKAQSIADHIRKTKVDCVFINAELTPGQIRNLKKLFQARMNNKQITYGLDGEQNDSETEWESDPETKSLTKSEQPESPVSENLKIRVFDRFSIILQIFAKRAKTSIAKLQIELNYLNYLKTRLVRSDGSTYSSSYNIFYGDLMKADEINLQVVSAKQRRAHAAMSGSGESQLEIERRQVRDKEAKIRRQLEQEKAIRDLNRKKKNLREISVPQIALVGYTNAGKSALMNCLLKREEVQSQDLLFQTLTTTARELNLPTGMKAKLLDTIGFISNLPHELIESFKTTLEEIEDSTVLIHLVDISNPNYEHQRASVFRVLRELGFEESFYNERMIEVWNKIDLVDEEHVNYPVLKKAREDLQLKNRIMKISATQGMGVKGLIRRVEELANKIMNKGVYQIKYGIEHHQRVLRWLKENANIPYDLKQIYTEHGKDRKYPQGAVQYELSLDAKTYGKLQKFLVENEVFKSKQSRQAVKKGMPPPGWNKQK